MDEDELMEFHPDYYSYKIKKRRIIHKLRMLSKEAIKKRINIRDVKIFIIISYWKLINLHHINRKELLRF